ncbi:MAG: acetolactate synthase large subunit [Pseudonocardiaceae bacterium]|nr:acetolactate synthase large subunit [Pseudonocardiaceae bacterium]
MDGAEAIVSTAVAAGMDVCFANPGTTELDLVAALDTVPGARAVLGTFEGVCTGAADGYARMADRPAWTMLHLGPGFANGAANLHNARRARSPVVGVVGDQASWHQPADAPLTTDIAGLAAPVSDWVGSTSSSLDAGADFAGAAALAATGRVATLLLPADHAWGDGKTAEAPDVALRRPAPATDAVTEAAAALRQARRPLVLLGGAGCRADGVRAAAAVAAATGAELVVETFPPRLERGAGLPAPAKLAYVPEKAAEALADHDVIVLAGARPPVTFFGYRGLPSALSPPGARVITIAGQDEDAAAGLAGLAAEFDAPAAPAPGAAPPQRPAGTLDLAALGAAVAAAQPEGAIVVDESNTSGVSYFPAAAAAPPHTCLSLTGGAIGFGPPAAAGAAVACPDRPVINLQADGSALYTLQALWTQAREGLDVTTVICANGDYRILRYELGRLGADRFGVAAAGLTDLGNPAVDWVSLAAGFGVAGRRAETAEELNDALAAALAEPGPHLVQACL